ncbi:hypothetical protein AUR64_15970 [Haloprofundus marisrubri]|uniref:DUF8159 domain-containing protein n=1 Tax=Haloprofundus marisrubri TaxID=1514971 RepID=A0A0W1R7U6_9EURY|nr:hypothetical protein [Haloprofundus marisrubri]KTG09281.1 hypothetical protein AUR64_15970 [Haloprofundus marisrubri]
MTDPSVIEEELRGNGISVESVDVDGGTEGRVDLTYMTAFPAAHVNRREVGQALTAFIDLAQRGEWEPAPVYATSIRIDDDVQGRWRADADWFDGYLSYNLSDEDFSELVLDTLEEEPSMYAGGDR